MKKALTYLLILAIITTMITILPKSSAQSLGFVTINPDGSVSPLTAPINQIGNTYTLENNLTKSALIIHRSNIVVDGAGFTIQGFYVYSEEMPVNLYPSNPVGITLSTVSNVTVKHFYIDTFQFGIQLTISTNNTIQGNAINADTGISIDASSNNNEIIDNVMLSGGLYQAYSIWCSASYTNIIHNFFNKVVAVMGTYNTVSTNLVENAAIFAGRGSFNTITYNLITGNQEKGSSTSIGIHVSDNNDTISGNYISGNSIFGAIDIAFYHQGNIVTDNYVTDNSIGISVSFVDNPAGYSNVQQINNFIYHNNFIGNTESTRFQNNSNAVYPMNTGYPINCWDNGSGGNYWSDYNGTDINGDGIGDTPYIIAPNNIDNYPLIAPLNIAKPSIQTATLPVKGIANTTQTSNLSPATSPSPIPPTSPPPTPTVTELSWLAILPLLLSVLSASVILRYRRTKKPLFNQGSA
jgi:nitrous oxidase accessory protein NosD